MKNNLPQNIENKGSTSSLVIFVILGIAFVYYLYTRLEPGNDKSDKLLPELKSSQIEEIKFEEGLKKSSSVNNGDLITYRQVNFCRGNLYKIIWGNVIQKEIVKSDIYDRPLAKSNLIYYQPLKRIEDRLISQEIYSLNLDNLEESLIKKVEDINTIKEIYIYENDLYFIENNQLKIINLETREEKLIKDKIIGNTIQYINKDWIVIEKEMLRENSQCEGNYTICNLERISRTDFENYKSTDLCFGSDNADNPYATELTSIFYSELTSDPEIIKFDYLIKKNQGFEFFENKNESLIYLH